MGIGFGRRRRTRSGGIFFGFPGNPRYDSPQTSGRKFYLEERYMANMGKWAFIVGFVICVVAGLLIAEPWMFWVLAILGLIVGFMNVTASETKGFLLAAIGLMLSASSVVNIPMIGVAVTAVLYNIVTFISAAVLVVALKSLFEIAKD
jgi:hypothetical protein